MQSWTHLQMVLSPSFLLEFALPNPHTHNRGDALPDTKRETGTEGLSPCRKLVLALIYSCVGPFFIFSSGNYCFIETTVLFCADAHHLYHKEKRSSGNIDIYGLYTWTYILVYATRLQIHPAERADLSHALSQIHAWGGGCSLQPLPAASSSVLAKTTLGQDKG